MEYYAAIRRNELAFHLLTWGDKQARSRIQYMHWTTLLQKLAGSSCFGTSAQVSTSSQEEL